MKAYQVVPTLNGVGRSFDLCVRVGGITYDIAAGDFDYDDNGEQVFMLTVPTDQEPDRPELYAGTEPQMKARGLTQRAFNRLAEKLCEAMPPSRLGDYGSPLGPPKMDTSVFAQRARRRTR